MARGELTRTSPILIALGAAERGTTGEIRVHLSKRWMERDPFRRATALFREFGMSKTAKRNAVLVYVNLRRRKFAIVADEGIAAAADQAVWDRISREFAVDLRSTHPENAVAMAVMRLGDLLRRNFPQEVGT